MPHKVLFCYARVRIVNVYRQTHTYSRVYMYMHTCAYGVNCCLSVIQHNHSTEQINNLTGFMPFERVQLPQTAHTHIYTHTKTNSIIYAHLYTLLHAGLRHLVA